VDEKTWVKRTYLSAAAIQNPVTKEMKHEIKMVPRRPNILLRGAFVQQPMAAEARYGAPFRRPFIHSFSMPNSWK
jgi:hypothetical protein